MRLLLDAATAQRERGAVERAQALLDEAYRISETEQRPEWIAAVRASQGVLERETGNLDAAGERLREAVELRRNASDPIGTARALGDLGRVHLEAGRSREAAETMDEALEIANPLDPGRTRAEVMENAGLVQERTGNVDRARDLYRKAKETYGQIGDSASAERVEAHLARIVDLGATSNLDEELKDLERRRLVAALEVEGWNQSRAARRLGVTETRVRNLMRRHGLRPRNRRGRPRKSGEPAPTSR
ncbi:MAG: tetratricopeptide repeat protein [Candidatus Eisenbacteria bacterium]|nr:tetratricopeptide repeat protein [Candidatus Eisenbacteria bacterium]